MPKRYFVFICCSANTSKSVIIRKGKKLILVRARALVLMLRQGRFHGDIRIIVLALAVVFALVLALAFVLVIALALKLVFTLVP